MFITNNLKSKNRYRSKSSEIYFYDEIGFVPFIIDKKTIKSKRSKSKKDSGRYLRIPVKVNKKSFVEKGLKIHVDILDDENMGNSMNVISMEPRVVSENAKILLSSNSSRITSLGLSLDVESIQQVNNSTSKVKQYFERNTSNLIAIDSSTRQSKGEKGLSADKKTIVSNANISLRNENGVGPKKKSLNIDTKIKKKNVSIIVKDQMINYHKYRKEKFITNKLKIRKTYQYSAKSIFSRKDIAIIKKSIRENISDEIAFGYEPYYELVKFRDNNSLKSKIILTNEIDRFSRSNIVRKEDGVPNPEERFPISRIIKDMYASGFDPLDSFVGYESHRNLFDKRKRERLRSTKKSKSMSRVYSLEKNLSGNQRRDKRKLQTANKVLTLRRKVFFDTDRKNKDKEYIAIEKRRIASYKTCMIDIPLSDIESSSSSIDVLNLRIRITNNKGFVTHSKKFNINLDTAKLYYHIDTFSPVSMNFNSIKSRRLKKREFGLELNSELSSTQTSIVYGKNILSGDDPDKKTFTNVMTRTFQPDRKNKIKLNRHILASKSGSGKTSFKINKYSDNNIFLRCITKLTIAGFESRSIIINNVETAQHSTFKSSHGNQKEKVNFVAESNVTKNNQKESLPRRFGSVTLTLDRVPKGAKKVNILRRDLESKRKHRFERVPNATSRVLPKKDNLSNSVKDRTIKIDDNSAIDGKRYEYAIEVVNRKGSRYSLPMKSKMAFNKPLNAISIGMRGIVKDTRSSGFKFSLDIDRNENKSIDSLRQKINDISSVIEDKKVAESDLIPKLNEVKQVLGTMDTAEVQIKNISDGTITSMGVYRNKDTVSFDGELAVGKNRVIVKPIMSDVRNDLEKINSILDNMPDRQRLDIGLDSKFNDLRDNVTKKITLENFKNRNYFRNGKKIVPNANRLEKSTIGDLTHDIASFDIDKEFRNRFDVIASKVRSVISPKNRVLLSFETVEEVSDIDFLILSAEKEGHESSVGTAIFNEGDRKINFIDYTNENYYGNIVYYARAVFNNGDISSRKFLRSVVLLNKLPRGEY